MAKNSSMIAIALIGAGVAAVAFGALRPKEPGEEPPPSPGGDPSRPESHTLSKLEVAYAVPE